MTKDNRPVANAAVLPSIRCMRDNILGMLRRDFELALQRKAWYTEAYVWALETAERFNTSIYMVASVAACISPSVDWDEYNMHMTEALFENPMRETFISATRGEVKMQGYGANVAKARRMIIENNPALLSGPKVTAFRDAILGIDSCVVDVHATNVAMGTENVYSGPAKNVYGIFVEAYTEVANIMGWKVMEVQAATWVVYKATKAKRGAVYAD